MIGVLFPRQKELREAALEFENSSIGSKVHIQQGEYAPFDNDRRVILATIHGAKGLEFRAVHILGTEHLKKFKAQKNLAFTAVTRCKTSLSIYSDDALPGYLEKGIAACGKKVAEPKIEDLFL
jgi:superfamily I DNA and RNA helicase